jgi:hypothetical protein
MNQRGRHHGGTSSEPTPELPDLAAGVRLLDIEDDNQAMGPLQSLVLDHLLMKNRQACVMGKSCP